MANLKNVIYMSNENYNTLITTGSVVIGGVTYTYDANNQYITPDTSVSFEANQGLTSTQKSNARANIEAGTYSKPGTGIPKTDLASDVQTSLGKADTALQSHQDISGKQDKTDNTLQTTSKSIVGAINETWGIAHEAEHLALEKSYSLSNINYSQLIANLQEYTEEASFNVGQSIYIETMDVPDVWISKNDSSYYSYTYTTDAAFITYITSGTGRVGLYTIRPLETLKQDLTTKQDKFATIGYTYDTRGYDAMELTHVTRILSSGGKLQSAVTPIADYDVVNKYYVDNLFPKIKSTLDSVLVPNTMYDLGEKSSLTLTLPSTATSCQEIYIAFKSYATATTLNIVGNYVGDTSYSPSAWRIVELHFKYVCGIWVLVVKETEDDSI